MKYDNGVPKGSVTMRFNDGGGDGDDGGTY